MVFNSFLLLGIVHHDDLQYLFYMSFIFPYLEKGDPENVMVEKMTAMWANFAKTGKPIPPRNNLFSDVSWTPLTTKNNNYLEIGVKLKMKSNMFSARYAFWEQLFPLTPLRC